MKLRKATTHQSQFKVFTRLFNQKIAKNLPWRPIFEKREERTPPPCFPKSGILIAWRGEDLSESGKPAISLPFS